MTNSANRAGFSEGKRGRAGTRDWRLIRSARRAAGKIAITLERLIRPRTKAEPALAKSVLVLEYMLPLGSCVHMTPVFEALRRARPDLILTVATRGLGLELLRHSPSIDHLIETPDPLTEFAAAAACLRRQLKARDLRPDCALTGASDQRTRIALLGATVCDGWRGGFAVLHEMYQRPLIYDWGKSLIANNLRLAEMFGYAGDVLEPRVFYTSGDAGRARALLASARGEGRLLQGSPISGARPTLVVVSQNSGGQRTGWHEQRFAEVIRYAHDVLGYAVVYVGTASDAAAIDELKISAGGVGVSLAGETSVNVLAALLALSDLVLSLDTGTMHVGRAVGVPMVVLGPSWQKPLEWLPLGKPQVRILRGEDRAEIPEGYRLDEITVAAVEEAIAELTQLYPASEEAREMRLAAGLAAGLLA